MHFSKTVIAAAMLFASAWAAPIDDTTAVEANVLVARNKVNLCGTSSFTDTTDIVSPKVADCKTIVKNIQGGGTWTNADVSGEWHRMVSFGTCSFGTLGISHPYKVGNQDIINLINDSIAKFAKNGRVGATGSMKCTQGAPGHKETNTARWRIVHA